MKHILFFNDSMEMGGTEKLLVSLLNHLVKKECTITLLLPQPSSKNILLKELSSSIHIQYIYKENTPYIKKKIEENIMIFYPRLFISLKRLEIDRFDEIICFKETFFSRIFSKIKRPKILWIHNILYKHEYETHTIKERFSVWLNKKHLHLVQKSYNNFDKVICVSDAAKYAYMSVLHKEATPNQKIIVLYNAIDLIKVKQLAEEPIKSLPQKENKFILVTRTSPEKRIDRLIDASYRLQNEGYIFHISIIGEGMNSQSMQDWISRLNLTDKITLIGRTDNPFPYIQQSDWSLCVSERESFSLVLLESMALNTPVITTDCGGPRDIIDGGKYGILVENSSEGVYQGMKMVLEDPSLSIRYSESLKDAADRFDFQHWLKNVENLLDI